MFINQVTIVKQVETCVACPSQWDAWDSGGLQYYIRYRWGNLTVQVDGPSGEFLFDRVVGGGLDGCMSWNEVLEHTGMKYIPGG